MATSVTTDVNLATGSLGDSSPGIAFNIEVAESLGSSTFSVPKRLKRRLEQTLENKSPASLEYIEAKLKDADYRRQQFHEWLVSKARPKRKLDQVSSPLSKDLAERLEARLSAAEQKRLEMLAQEQTRLAKLHELRMAAKTEAQLRAEREREELGSKVEFRVQQAETNRMAIVEAEKQRRAAANERMAQSIMQRTSMEDEHRERTEALRAAICQKSAAAEEKRAVLLQAEKNRAQAICMQARKVAEAVVREREVELNQRKEKLEARLLRAKSQRAEYLRQKGGCRGACHNHGHKLHKHGDRLCRKLTKCWRQFRGSMKTTYALAEEFTMAGINQSVVSTLPFEEVAERITSPGALKSAKAFLARIESRLMLSSATDSTELPNVDALLKRLAPPQRKSTPAGVSRTGKRLPVKLPAKPKESSEDNSNLERYPARVFLCAYMIVGHPEAVFSTNGDREAALGEAAKKLLPEFEALVDILLNRPSSVSTPPSSPMLDDDSFSRGQHKPFAAQLLSFDTAWQSYLCRFVAWKVKDAQLLEEDLIRAACRLEVSMLQKCKVVPGEASALTHDTEAIRKQVAEDQRLLRDRIVHLTGKTGLEKMEEALLAVRSKFLEAKENGVSLPSPFAYSSPEDLKTVQDAAEGESSERPKSKVARSLFSSSPEVIDIAEIQNSGLTNERMLNNMMHDGNWKTVKHGNSTGSLAKIEEQIRTTMERAFWDRVEESLLSGTPEYTHVVTLVAEIRDDLEGIVPAAWKQGLRESLDLEILSQVLESGSNDFAYLRGLLDYTLDLIGRLGAPSRDEQAKSAHQNLIEDLSKATPTKESFGKAVVKGIRFVFERLQELKQDINSALTQLVSGSAGIDYLRNAFAERYNLKTETAKEAVLGKLPRTVQWFQAVVSTIESQKAEAEAAMRSLKPVQIPDSQAKVSPAFPMCTGGRVVVSGTSSLAKQKAAVTGVEDSRMGSISWGSTEAVVRLGLLEIISASEPATEAALPETLALNAGRLVDCQNDFQRAVVMATGLLLLRQELMTKVPVVQLEEIVKEAYNDLNSLLSEPLASVTRIGSLLAGIGAKHCSQHYPDVNVFSEFMARVLDRSLSAGDGVFGRVTAAIRSSLRAILLVGNGADGVSLAECSLKRIGGGLLVNDVLNLAKRLDKISNITAQVHGLWYSRML